MKLFDKRAVSLAGLKGQVIVINYWATWCGPCKAEMPMLHEYYRMNHQRGLVMFGVTTEDSLPPFRLKKLAAALSYPLAAGIKGPYGAINNALPTAYIIDRKGIIRHAKTGGYDAHSFTAAAEPLL